MAEAVYAALTGKAAPNDEPATQPAMGGAAN